MLKIVGIVAAVLAVTVAAILIYAATRPDTLHVARTASIKAPPDKVFALINDLRGWRTWSPYEKKDPQMKRTFGAVTAGKGAVYEWDGDKNVGQGRMEITEAQPSKVVIALQFIRPFEISNTATFAIVPQGDATNVTWAMDGPCVFIGKVMGIFIDMDRMIGKDFEEGLVSLKALAEK